MSWSERAACIGTDASVFFPELGNSTAEAKAICASCPVQRECDAAGANEDFGVWGGKSAMERHTGNPRTSTYVRLETVLTLLRSVRWLTATQIGERLGMSPDAARRALYRLKDQGLCRNDHGYWFALNVEADEKSRMPPFRGNKSTPMLHDRTNVSSTGAP